MSNTTGLAVVNWLAFAAALVGVTLQSGYIAGAAGLIYGWTLCSLWLRAR